MAAIIGNSTALNAVVSSSTAMTAIASSSTAMTAVASSNTARTAITRTLQRQKNALASSPLKTTVTKGNGNGWENRTIRNGMGYLISCYNANSGGEAGSTWYKLDGAQTSQPQALQMWGNFSHLPWQFTGGLLPPSVTYIPC